ncbi:hypothetical protein L0664_17860 [Octadecabacter sp. G9-8]|uniref:Uncharacterized protein n=1 Tax=Octadecabacter dasysiphoniae TaxID=2909341 RepID=A0ABS9D085_9RHOB|nr:hypothetical protein [Octadecabacter dasysiphoniae]MCF2872935.1 hypothetical protein [Octadecabacter dasysiphoniae]
MMPVVRISDAALADLKLISKWLETDTPSKTVEKVVSKMMVDLGLERDEGEILREEGGVPGLSFTKVTKATIDGTELKNPKWNSVLIAVIEQVRKKIPSSEALSSHLQINGNEGRLEDHGYKFYPQLGISVQGQSAPDAWREVQRLAKKHSVSVRVGFQWRDNPKAEHPGQNGTLNVDP